jgi:hypothetical protein
MEAVRYRSLESMVVNEAPITVSSGAYESFLAGYVPAARRESRYAMHGDRYSRRQAHAHQDTGYNPSPGGFDMPLEAYLGKASIASPMERMGSYMKHCHACGRENNPHMTKEMYGKDSYSMGDHEDKQTIKILKTGIIPLLN